VYKYKREMFMNLEGLAFNKLGFRNLYIIFIFIMFYLAICTSAQASIICGHADESYYYLGTFSPSEGDNGHIYIYDKNTHNLVKTIDNLPLPRYLTSNDKYFISTYNEQATSGDVWAGIAIYDKSNNLNLIKQIPIHRHPYTDYSIRQPLIDENNIYVPQAEADSPIIKIYESTAPFDKIDEIVPAHGDINSAAIDNNYVAIATAFYGYHQYVYDKQTHALVADIIGSTHGEGLEFYKNKYLVIGYHGNYYRKYDYSNLQGTYKQVVLPDVSLIWDVQLIHGCDNLLFRVQSTDGTDKEVIVDPETDQVISVHDNTVEGWMESLSCSSEDIFKTDFENYNIGTTPSEFYIYYNGCGNNYQVITTDESLSGSKSFQVWGCPSWCSNVHYYFTKPETGRIGYQVWVKANPKEEAVVQFVNPEGATWSWGWGGIVFNQDGYITAPGGFKRQHELDKWL
jgi:hypothetical protein